MEPILLVHGGAGNIPNERVPGKLTGCKKSVQIGYKILKNGGSALDAVEAAVRYMEDDENFNAGEYIHTDKLTMFFSTKQSNFTLVKF